MGDRGSRPSSPQAYNNFPIRKPLQNMKDFPSSPPLRGSLSLNKDFCEVLDNGSLQDVEKMLESCGAKPEVSRKYKFTLLLSIICVPIYF